jgi:hypothetical protein
MRLILVVLAVAAATVAVADGIRIRAEFAPGQQFHYTWELEGTNTWTPPISGTMSGTMRTDFDFDLVAERVVDGEATFLVKGRSLESVAKGPKGALGINASPEQAKLLLGKTWTKPGPKTPLKNRITLTLGPRFNVTGSSGLQHIALYFLPGVDHRVWFALMTAPKTPLEPGKGWTQKFRVPIKELGDRPLDVDLHFRVDESTTEDGRRVVVVRLSGKLGLTDFDVDLKKGRTLHVTSGTYSVTGRTEWDAARGIPLTIEAEQWIDAEADNPVATFEHHARSHLALVEAGR